MDDTGPTGRPESGSKAAPTTTALDRLRAAVGPRLGIDARALGAFRIGIGLLLLADLAIRSRDLVTFYTDAGVLPRSVLESTFPGFETVSLHALSGSVVPQASLFVLAAVFAVALTAGYRTRIAAVGSWLLLFSLQARNPFVLNGGDTVLLVALFVGLFAPLGERYSIDALRRTRPPRPRIVSVASATLLVQIVLVYFTNGLYKFESDLWLSGSATAYIFALDGFTVFLGPYLADAPTLLWLINWAWFGLLVASPLLLFTRGILRTGLVVAFLGAHLSMALTMRLGLFPLVMCVCLLAFLPSSTIDRLAGWNRLRPLRRSVSIPAALRSLPPTADGFRVPPAARRRGRQTAAAFLAALLFCSLAWQAAAVGYIGTPDRVDSTVDPEEHGWKMFAPSPPTTDRWYAVSAETTDGESIDALHGGPATTDRPPDIAASYPTALWHRYLNELPFAGAPAQEAFADYLCRTAPDRHGTELDSLTVYYVEQPTGPENEGEPQEFVLYDGPCPN
ncbi:MAG: HTTM domain-containing protein [Natronomonas sp.]